MTRLLNIKVTVEGKEKPSPIRSFQDAGFHPAMLNNVKLCGYDILTPIQCYTIPAVLLGLDVIAVAQTGMRWYTCMSFTY